MENMYSEPELKDLSIRVIQESRAQNEVIYLEQRLEERKKELEQAEAEKNKEVKEAENIDHIFMRLLFSAKVEKEELQAYAAQERYDLALEAYTAAKEQLQKAKRKLAELEGSKEKYEKKYATTRSALLKEKGEVADKILGLEKEIDTLTVECKEVNEALDLCNEAFETAVLILNRIGDAKYTAKMDYALGAPDASLTDLSKLNSEMEATKLTKELAEMMKRLRKEVGDIGLCTKVRDGCLDIKNFPVWFKAVGTSTPYWENKHINEWAVQVTALTDDISNMRKELESYCDECRTSLCGKKKELEQIMYQ